MLLVPVMKTISIHSLRVLVRQHEQNLDDEPIVFNFNAPSEELVDSIEEEGPFNSDPFTSMESSVFDLRIKRLTGSAARTLVANMTSALPDEGATHEGDGDDAWKSAGDRADYDYLSDLVVKT